MATKELVHLLYGTESVLFDTYIEKLQKKYIPEEELDLNVIHYDLEETPVEQVLEDASTPSFFGEYKLLIVHQANIFTGEKAKLSHDVDALLAYLDSPAPFTILVFLVGKEKLDERKKITKKCKQLAHVEAMLSPKKEREFLDYIRKTARQYGVSIQTDAAEKLYDLVGNHLTLLDQELQKCATYLLSEQTKEISLQLVTDLVARSIEDDVFQLTELLLKRKMHAAVFVLNDLKKQKVEPILILGALTSNFRLFFQVKLLLKMGLQENEIVSQLKVSPYRVKLAIQKVQPIPEEKLKAWIRLIGDLDEQLKSHHMDGYLSLELFVLHFSV